MIWAGGAGVCWVYAVWVVVVFLPGFVLLVGVGAVSVQSFWRRPCPPGAAGVGVVVVVRPLGLVLAGSGVVVSSPASGFVSEGGWSVVRLTCGNDAPGLHLVYLPLHLVPWRRCL